MVAAKAPKSCAIKNIETLLGLVPAKVFVKDRAKVTAGLANDVEEVNQYADVIYADTIRNTKLGRNFTPV